eukprot:6182103-Pleurochrysis_carterae.AAC.2
MDGRWANTEGSAWRALEERLQLEEAEKFLESLAYVERLETPNESSFGSAQQAEVVGLRRVQCLAPEIKDRNDMRIHRESRGIRGRAFVSVGLAPAPRFDVAVALLAIRA